MTVTVLDEDSTTLEIQGTDTKKRYFRASTTVFCEEWVSAIRSAIKAHARRPAGRRATLNNFRGVIEDTEEEYEKTDVNVLLVSLKSSASHAEVVITRNPEWNRVITISAVKFGDQIIISTSNGGQIILQYENIMMRAEDGHDFDVAVQGVPLASSIKISLELLPLAYQMLDRQRQRINGKQSIHSRLVEWAAVVTSDRASAISTVLSLMVLMAGVRSLSSRAIGPEGTLLLLFAGALSIYNLYRTIEAAREGAIAMTTQQGGNRGLPLRLVLHGHTFTSPDAPINDPESEIPQRFITGCDGDMKEARRRWDITRHWREAEGVNTILDEPQPYFFLIKKMYPHYHAGRGRDGHVVFYERPGDFENAQLASRGVNTDHLIRHWLFTTEYQWNVLCNGDDLAKGIAVIDIGNVKMGDLAGDNLSFLKKTIAFANQHYPERSHVIFIINAPFFFSMLWRVVKPLVHENTQKKVRILSSKETLSGLQEHISIENIPVFYGGQLTCGDGSKDCCRFSSEESLAINDFVRRINDRHSVGSKVPFDGMDGLDSESPLPSFPPGEQGDIHESDRHPVPGVAARRGSNATTDDWSVASATTIGQPAAQPSPQARRASLNPSPRNSGGGHHQPAP